MAGGRWQWLTANHPAPKAPTHMQEWHDEGIKGRQDAPEQPPPHTVPLPTQWAWLQGQRVGKEGKRFSWTALDVRLGNTHAKQQNPPHAACCSCQQASRRSTTERTR